LSTQWKQYSGPAQAIFADASRTNATVTIPSAGEYLFVLSAADGIHTPRYSAVLIIATTIASVPTLNAKLQGRNIVLSWDASQGPATLEATSDLGRTGWLSFATNTTGTITLAASAAKQFYRLLVGTQ